MGKAQSSLEYLLLVGGAILVAVILIGIIISITSSAEPETLLATAHALCAKFPEQECINGIVSVRGNTFICDTTLQNTCRAVRAEPLSACGSPSGGWQSGKTYYLTDNVTTANQGCFAITTPNVTLNCKNKTVMSTYGSGALPLVLLFGSDNSTIKNCVAVGGDSSYGISVYSSNNKIINNKIVNSHMPPNGKGIWIFGLSSGNSLIRNNACEAGVNFQIGILYSTSPQAADSTQNICDICTDSYTVSTGNPSPVCNSTNTACPLRC